MNQRKIVAGAAGIVLALLIAWFVRSADSASKPSSTESVGTAQSSAVARDAQVLEIPAAESQSLRGELAAPPAATDGLAALLVLATWAEDGKSAQGIGVRVRREWQEDPRAREHAAVLDAEGSARLERLAPGTYRIRFDRCAGGTIVLGAEKEGVFACAIPRGVSVSGRVLDGEERPVAQAQIQLFAAQESNQGAQVAVSDAAGRFFVRDVEPGRAFAASAKNRQPSLPVSVEAEAGERVELVLRLDGLGGNLDVQVFDARGLPVAGAEVLLGDERAHMSVAKDGSLQRSAPARTSRTDAEGRCRFSGIAVGEVNVSARDRAHAPWSGKALVEASRDTALNLRLPDGGSIEGVVFDDESKPLSGVMLGAGGPQSFTIVEAVSAADGSFLLEALAPGLVEVWARGGNAGSLQERLEVRAGEATFWEVRLRNERLLAGRVLDEQGQALEGWTVQVCPRGKLAEHSSADRTDAQGHFRLNSIPREATWLALHAPNAQVRHPALILRKFPLGQEDFVIRVPRDSAPSAFISGSLVDQQLGAAL
jgi:protocatechuate 3,4-dioxygenase beta subunit